MHRSEVDSECIAKRMAPPRRNTYRSRTAHPDDPACLERMRAQGRPDRARKMRPSFAPIQTRPAQQPARPAAPSAIDVYAQVLEKGDARVSDDAAVVVQFHVARTHQRIGQ